MTDLLKMQAEADRIDLAVFRVIGDIDSFYDEFSSRLSAVDKYDLLGAIHRMRSVRRVIRSHMNADRREATS